MDRHTKERLITLGSSEFESLLSDYPKLVFARKEDFCKWMREEVELKFLPNKPIVTDIQKRARRKLIEYLASLEVTHDLEQWIETWITLFTHVKKAPDSRIDELTAHYEKMAQDQNWEPLPEQQRDPESCPQVHDIIQRGFKAHAKGEDEMPFIEELEAFCNRDGNVMQKDNSNMTAIQRCRMLGWDVGEDILARHGAE